MCRYKTLKAYVKFPPFSLGLCVISLKLTLMKNEFGIKFAFVKI